MSTTYSDEHGTMTMTRRDVYLRPNDKNTNHEDNRNQLMFETSGDMYVMTKIGFSPRNGAFVWSRHAGQTHTVDFPEWMNVRRGIRLPSRAVKWIDEGRNLLLENGMAYTIFDKIIKHEKEREKMEQERFDEYSCDSFDSADDERTRRKFCKTLANMAAAALKSLSDETIMTRRKNAILACLQDIKNGEIEKDKMTGLVVSVLLFGDAKHSREGMTWMMLNARVYLPNAPLELISLDATIIRESFRRLVYTIAKEYYLNDCCAFDPYSGILNAMVGKKVNDDMDEYMEENGPWDSSW